MSSNAVNGRTEGRNGEVEIFDFYEWSGLRDLSLDSIRHLNWHTSFEINDPDLRRFFKKTLQYYSWMKRKEGGIDHNDVLPQMPDIEEESVTDSIDTDTIDSPASPNWSVVMEEEEESSDLIDEPCYSPSYSPTHDDDDEPFESYDAVAVVVAEAAAVDNDITDPAAPAAEVPAYDRVDEYSSPQSPSIDSDTVDDNDDISCVWEAPTMKKRRRNDSEVSNSLSKIRRSTSEKQLKKRKLQQGQNHKRKLQQGQNRKRKLQQLQSDDSDIEDIE